MTDIKQRILDAGLSLWPHVTARSVAKIVGRSHTAVQYHYGTTDALKAAIAAEAVRVGHAGIVPHLIALRHPAAATISAADKARYLAGC